MHWPSHKGNKTVMQQTAKSEDAVMLGNVN